MTMSLFLIVELFALILGLVSLVTTNAALAGLSLLAIIIPYFLLVSYYL